MFEVDAVEKHNCNTFRLNAIDKGQVQYSMYIIVKYRSILLKVYEIKSGTAV
jgi:hypothetical protein